MKKHQNLKLTYGYEYHFPKIRSEEPRPFLFEEWAGIYNLVCNCFAFACNVLPQVEKNPPYGEYHVIMPNPGTTGGRTMRSMTTRAMRDALVADGFIYVQTNDQSTIKVAEGQYLVAAYVAPDYDYHLYRRAEETGIWYHTLWENPVTALDWDHEVIRDPQKAHRAVYDDFAGYFLVPSGGIKLDIKIERIGAQRPKKQPLISVLRRAIGLGEAC